MKKYSITYKLITDPTKVQQNSLLNECKSKGINIIDEFPGNIFVAGNEDNIKEVLSSYPQWSYSLSQQVSI